jgi:hypothetical protein
MTILDHNIMTILIMVNETGLTSLSTPRKSMPITKISGSAKKISAELNWEPMRKSTETYGYYK